MAEPSGKHILRKGLACSTCKQRKVRCDAAKPACTACRRSARFRGDDPNLVLCSYSAARRCGPAPGSSAGAKRVKNLKTASAGPIGSIAVEAASSEGRRVGEAWIEQAFPSSFPTLAAPALPLPAYASTSGTSASTSTAPLSIPLHSSTAASPRFNLPAPIPVQPASQQVPAFVTAAIYSPPQGNYLLPLAQAYNAAVEPPFAAPYPYYPMDQGAFSSSALPSLVSSPETFGAVSSPSSVYSFNWSDGVDTPSSTSSLTGSPFSLCDDLDFALAAAASNTPEWGLPATPAFYSPLDPFATAFSEDKQASLDSVFLPTAQGGEKTLALPLFGF